MHWSACYIWVCLWGALLSIQSHAHEHPSELTTKYDSLKQVYRSASSVESRADALYALARLYWRTSHDSVVRFAQESLTLSEAAGYTHGIANALNALSYVAERQGRYADALPMRQRSLAAYQAVGDKAGIAWCYHSLGSINNYQGNFDRALEYHFAAMRLREEIGDTRGLCWSLNNIADVYNSQHLPDDGLEYGLKSLTLSRSIGLQDSECSALVGIAISYKLRRDYDQALTYSEQALELSNIINDKRYADLALNNLGEIYALRGENDKALKFHFRALEIRESLGVRLYVAQSLVHIGGVYFAMQDYDNALRYGRKGLELAQEVGGRSEIKDACWILAAIYSAKKDFQSAWQYQQKFIALKDSLISIEMQKNIASLQSKLEREKQQRQIEMLKKENENQDLVRNSLIGGVVLVSLIALLVANGYRQKQRKNQALTALNQALAQERLIAQAERNAAQTANAFKSELLSIAAHDLKNPLQSIMGFAALIEEKNRGNPEVELMTNAITRASTRMLNLISGLLQSAAIESGKFELNKRDTSVSQLLELVVEQNHAQAEQKHQQFICDIEPNLFADIDAERMRDVFDNLISNAIKYSPTGKTIYVEMKRNTGIRRPETDAINTLPSSDSCILISIRDEGQGLTDDDKKKLFGKFQRLSARPTSGESSTGLGLSIVKQLVELHGGRVWAESAGKDQGTTFFVELAAKKTSDSDSRYIQRASA